MLQSKKQLTILRNNSIKCWVVNTTTDDHFFKSSFTKSHYFSSIYLHCSSTKSPSEIFIKGIVSTRTAKLSSISQKIFLENKDTNISTNLCYGSTHSQRIICATFYILLKISLSLLKYSKSLLNIGELYFFYIFL